jgi:effector-binding domain-containing protein
MSSPIEAEIIELEETLTAAVRVECPPAEVGAGIEAAHHDIGMALAEAERRPVGPPFARFSEIGDDQVVFEIGIPIDGLFLASGRVEPLTLPGGRAAATIHIGPYRGLGSAYRALEAWLDSEGHEKAGLPWEVYLTDPELTPDEADWKTQIVWPIN